MYDSFVFRSHSVGIGGARGGGGVVKQGKSSRGHCETRRNAAMVAPFCNSTSRFCTAHASRSSCDTSYPACANLSPKKHTQLSQRSSSDREHASPSPTRSTRPASIGHVFCARAMTKCDETTRHTMRNLKRMVAARSEARLDTDIVLVTVSGSSARGDERLNVDDYYCKRQRTR